MIEARFKACLLRETRLEIKGIRFADRSIPWLRSNSAMDYQKGEINIRNLLIEMEDLRSSAVISG